MMTYMEKFHASRRRLRTFLMGPQLLAFMPAASLAAFWLGGEVALVLIALFVPAILALAGFYTVAPDSAGALDPATGLALRSAAVLSADRHLSTNEGRHGGTAALIIEIDDFSELTGRIEPRAADAVLAVCANRLLACLRNNDVVARLEGPRFAIVLSDSTRANLGTLIEVSARIQREIEEPVIVDAARIFVSASVGFCDGVSAPERTGEALLGAAEDALADTAGSGGGAIRAYAPDIRKRAQARHALTDELPAAIEDEQIRPWFQPQISTESGVLIGVEVLARWAHPERGIIPPIQFLDAAAELGLMGRLGEMMLYQSLRALHGWDNCGIKIPSIAFNFSSEELRNPVLVDRIRWELDRFDIAPERLAIEVLETVIAQTENDTIVRNLRALSELGCRIDLDDFGTGHASITNIKRFSVSRIKIDRSFVTQLDSDPEQQTIVGAILTMADQLGLESLAEGVETPGEHRILKTLGCDYLQGFGIARPMPLDDVAPWVESYRKRHTDNTGATQPFSSTHSRLPAAQAGKTA